MANLPTSPIIAQADPNIAGVGYGMNAGSSDSVIGICTDEPNPKDTVWARIVLGARRRPIGMETSAQYLVEYEVPEFTGTPVGFAEADAIAAP